MINIQEHLEKMKNIQKNLLDFLNNETDSEEYFQNLKNIFDDLKICDDQYMIKSILRLILKISNNIHPETNFYDKIFKILLNLKDEIQKKYANWEIFNIFKSNKRILLFLIEEKIFIFDSNFVKKIATSKYIEPNYPQYFSPEIKPFINEKWFSKKKFDDIISFIKNIPEKLNEERKNGQNDEYICKLIQKDSIEEFITYYHQNSLQIESEIKPSIYETNHFLIKKSKKKQDDDYYYDNDDDNDNTKQGIQLIEYAAFYGSIQIFKFLYSNGAKLRPTIWLYAVHSNNPELFHILEENKIELEDNSYKEYLFESIKCHHNEFANYFLNNYFQDDENISKQVFLKALKYHNYAFINDSFIGQSCFYELCKYDYPFIVSILCQQAFLDVNYKKQKYKNKNERELSKYKEKSSLFVAIEKENIEIIKLLLLNKNIDINVPCIKYKSYFDNASDDWLDNDDISCNYSAEEYYNKIRKQKTPIILAIEKENIDIIKLLLAFKNLDINTPYIRKYRKRIFDPNDIDDNCFKEKPALFFAIKTENIEIIEQLLTNEKINVNAIYKNYQMILDEKCKILKLSSFLK